MSLEYIKPNNRLELELKQVSQEAGQVSERLRGVNLMPRKFPVEALEQICVSLAGLKDGTAEGCLEPLNYARHMLPLVRRDHFHLEGEEPELANDDDAYFVRDHPLDQSLARLYLAVGTALDEYRAQAQDHYDDRVGAEETLAIGDGRAFSEISQRSGQLAREAAKEREKLSDMAQGNSAIVGNLSRQLQDGTNIAHSVQSQIRIRPLVARWYKSAGKALSALPNVIIDTMDKVDVGTDIAQIWHKEWSAFKGRVRDLAYDQVKGLAEAVKATAERLKRGQATRGKPIEQQRNPAVLEAEHLVKQMLLEGTQIPEDLALIVERLEFTIEDGEIQRPEDLLGLKNLELLLLRLEQYDNVSFERLAELPNLRNLSTVAKTEKDVRDLSNLSNLERIALYANELLDISAIGRLSNLTHLSITAHQIASISALEHIPNLQSLNIRTDGVRDISVIGKLEHLTNLSIQAHKVDDISSLANLNKLETLLIHAHGVSDISALANFPNLTNLSLHANNASDVKVLGKLQKLTNLTVQAHAVRDISAVAQLTNLRALSVHVNKVKNIKPLAALKDLATLTVHTHLTDDISPLADLGNLKHLRVETNNVTNFSSLAKLTNLESLTVSASRATNLSDLGKLTALNSLSITANGMTHLKALSPLVALTQLSVTANSVEDFSVLGDLTQLEKLTVTANAARDLSALGKLANLKDLTITAGHVDLSWIGKLAELTKLSVASVRDFDLRPLAGLENLQDVKLSNVRYRNAHMLTDVDLEFTGASEEIQMN